MLRTLNISNLAVVESLELDFEQGFTALTGETGAGKSILLTALGLALGERADSTIVRPGQQRADISLEFDVSDRPEARQWLDDHEHLDDGDGNSCLIRRTVSADGRSKAYINGRPATLQSLQGLTPTLIEIHGQHEHLKLFKSVEQRRLLDEYADNHKRLAEIGNLYKKWRSASDETARLLAANEEKNSRLELLRFQIDELERHEVKTSDYTKLVDEHQIQANIEKILSQGQEQLTRLYDDEQNSVNVNLGRAILELTELAELAPEFGELPAPLNEALIQVQEASIELRRRLETLEAEPDRFAWLDEQLGVLHNLARKHQVDPTQLAPHLSQMREELSAIEQSSERIDELAKSLAEMGDEYKQLATKLSGRRADAAKRLSAQVSTMVRELGMPNGDLKIDLKHTPDDDPKLEGNDLVEFMITTNPGLPPQALARVASGGELSRISLAVQVTAMNQKTTPTMIFDEVDAGIGGGIAEIVGKQLRVLGANRQVLCVTHLPQVAAQSHHHYLVEKTSDKRTTQSNVRCLDRDQRRQEIARMLGGVKITEQTLAHAEEMLQWATD